MSTLAWIQNLLERAAEEGKEVTSLAVPAESFAALAAELCTKEEVGVRLIKKLQAEAMGYEVEEDLPTVSIVIHGPNGRLEVYPEDPE